ncbi:MAG: hypothetical protein AB1465_04395 [Patescibacteria group bacterium]
MPIQVKTMRDIWDKERKKKAEEKCLPFAYRKIFPSEIAKYHLNYLARKKVFLETKDEIGKIFADYENRLGEAGFSKV